MPASQRRPDDRGSPREVPEELGPYRGRVIRDIATILLTRVRAHVILESEITLIDCGLAGSARPIRRAVAALGRSMDEVTRVICTHGHPDHAGGARELAAAGVPIHMHAADAGRLGTCWREFVRRPSRGRLFAAMTPTPPAIVPLEDGQILPVLGGLEVLHTPGHTPGSVCLYGPRDRVLFVGDMLQAPKGRVTFANGICSDDIVTARRQVRRLATLDVKTIVFSHYPPLKDAARSMLEGLAAQV
jgi:glyoxylase-like metal-dependent hydrolase (beta-lactamase superfamily II)